MKRTPLGRWFDLSFRMTYEIVERKGDQDVNVLYRTDNVGGHVVIEIDAVSGSQTEHQLVVKRTTGQQSASLRFHFGP